MKKVLLISYHFPPSPAVGGLRSVNFAKNLPEQGWEPGVLTLPIDDIVRDDTHLAAMSNVRVERVAPWPTLTDLYKGIKHMLRRGSDQRSNAASTTASVGGAAVVGWRQEVRRFLLSLLTVPDGERGWILPAAMRAAASVRRHRYGCIVTSCPPYSVHLVGLLVKRFTGVRWIADFRDPWMSGGKKTLYLTSAFSLKLDRWFERKVVEQADVIVANTDALTNSLRQGYPQLSPNKFVTITNSIDIENFAPYWSVPKSPIFTITYAGSFYFNRSPEPVFAAIRQLLDERRLQAHAVRVVLAGHCETVGAASTVEIVRRYDLEGIVTIHSPLPHADALRLIRTSHLAMLLAPTQPNQIPAKAYDYIGLGTEILALASKGATADLVKAHNVGSVYEPTDISGIAEFIQTAYDNHSAMTEPGHPHAADSFDARVNARRLAALLDAATALGAVREVAV